MSNGGAFIPKPARTPKAEQQKNSSQRNHGSMGKRGVARFMHDMPAHGQAMDMSHKDRLEMLKMHHQQTLWIYWTLVPMIQRDVARPTAKRFAPASRRPRA